MSAIIPPPPQQHFLLPEKKEMMNAIVWATCTIFETSEDVLFTSTSRDAANIRHYIYFIFYKHLEIKDKVIVERTRGKSRSAVLYGSSVVDAHKTIYRQCSDTLKKIVELANTFEKKHTWLIPSINTTH